MHWSGPPNKVYFSWTTDKHACTLNPIMTNHTTIERDYVQAEKGCTKVPWSGSSGSASYGDKGLLCKSRGETKHTEGCGRPITLVLVPQLKYTICVQRFVVMWLVLSVHKFCPGLLSNSHAQVVSHWYAHPVAHPVRMILLEWSLVQPQNTRMTCI